jgi:transposase
LPVVVESPPRQEGCRVCGVIAHSHGRRTVRLVDAPCMGRPVEVVWRKRTWRCGESTCPTGGWTELEGDLARPRALLTTRACWWTIGQLRREHASVAGLARQLGTTWRTVWRSIQPLLEALAEDETRFADVTALGVDEHVWHHVSTKPVDAGGRGPKELTGMVDLTRDTRGRVRARLLDLVPGRSGKAYADWLKERGDAFRAGVEVATLDPFHGSHLEVWLAWTCAQRLRAAYRHPNPVEGRRIAERVVETFPTCPVTEIARSAAPRGNGRPRSSRTSTPAAVQRRTEAINGLIELHRRIARGFTNRETLFVVAVNACCRVRGDPAQGPGNTVDYDDEVILSGHLPSLR